MAGEGERRVGLEPGVEAIEVARAPDEVVGEDAAEGVAEGGDKLAGGVEAIFARLGEREHEDAVELGGDLARHGGRGG